MILETNIVNGDKRYRIFVHIGNKILVVIDGFCLT